MFFKFCCWLLEGLYTTRKAKVTNIYGLPIWINSTWDELFHYFQIALLCCMKQIESEGVFTCWSHENSAKIGVVGSRLLGYFIIRRKKKKIQNLADISDIMARKPMILIATKSDLLPKDVNLELAKGLQPNRKFSINFLFKYFIPKPFWVLLIHHKKFIQIFWLFWQEPLSFFWVKIASHRFEDPMESI